MQRATKTIAEWQKHVDEYKKTSEKLQKRITRSLRTIWVKSADYKKCEVQKLIDHAGTLISIKNH